MIKREKKVKMIVSDLDGTLLNSQGHVSLKTKNILIEKQKQGKCIVMATGRTLGSSKYAMDDFSFADYIIINNGAAIYNVSKEFFLWQDSFFIETAIQIFEAYKEKCSAFQICSVNYSYKYSKKIEISMNPSILPVRDFASLVEKNIPVCVIELLGLDSKDISSIVEEINKDYPLLEAVVMQDSFSENKWIDVMKKGVGKAHALQKLQDILGILERETVIFGDGKNDIEMLSKNGFGVAMENALPEVKKVCQDITTSHDEDGIVKWLDKNDV